MNNTLQDDFANAVRAMIEWSNEHTRTGYISQDDAAPFVASLPEFWREPARVMAASGYYNGTDTWIANHAA